MENCIAGTDYLFLRNNYPNRKGITVNYRVQCTYTYSTCKLFHCVKYAFSHPAYFIGLLAFPCIWKWDWNLRGIQSPGGPPTNPYILNFFLVEIQSFSFRFWFYASFYLTGKKGNTHKFPKQLQRVAKYVDFLVKKKFDDLALKKNVSDFGAYYPEKSCTCNVFVSTFCFICKARFLF